MSTWRRWAVKLAQHASSALPGVHSPWAEAMRREIDYIADDAAALRWAIGCVLASYRTRLMQWFNPRTSWRQVAASSALILLLAVALYDSAGGQTEPPRPAPDETICDPVASPELRQDRGGLHRPTDAAHRTCRSDRPDPLNPKK